MVNVKRVLREGQENQVQFLKNKKNTVLKTNDVPQAKKERRPLIGIVTRSKTIHQKQQTEKKVNKIAQYVVKPQLKQKVDNKIDQLVVPAAAKKSVLQVANRANQLCPANVAKQPVHSKLQPQKPIIDKKRPVASKGPAAFLKPKSVTAVAVKKHTQTKFQAKGAGSSQATVTAVAVKKTAQFKQQVERKVNRVVLPAAKKPAFNVYVEKREKVDKVTQKSTEAEATIEKSDTFVELALKLAETSLEECDPKNNLPEYFEDNFKYMKSKEALYRPRHTNYMEKQSEIDHSMRSTLVDWLAEVSAHYEFYPETMYLAVSYLDRFLSRMEVTTGKLQLVGLTALLIAAKVEETCWGVLSDYTDICDNLYSMNGLKRMETLMLRILSFDLMVPTPLDFLKQYCILADLKDDTKLLAMYVCELSLLQPESLEYAPSCVAAGAVVMARLTNRVEDVWPRSLEKFSGYTLDDLVACLRLLQNTYTNAKNSELKEITKNFRNEKYLKRLGLTN